jgi:hypothetical protein
MFTKKLRFSQCLSAARRSFASAFAALARLQPKSRTA